MTNAPLVRGMFLRDLNCGVVVRATDADPDVVVPDIDADVSAIALPAIVGMGAESFEVSVLPAGNQLVCGRVALVTGGAQGFGAELVRGLVEQGCFCFIADRNICGAQVLADELGELAWPVEVNVADEVSVARMFDDVEKVSGGVDLVVSNAGVLRAGSVLTQPVAEFELSTNVNYLGFFLVAQAAARLMRRHNAVAPQWLTDIVQINSKSGLVGSNRNGAYSGSKFGGIGLVQSFALELVDHHIKVNAICPGNFYDGPLWSDPDNGLFVQYLRSGKVPGATSVAQVREFYEAKTPMRRGATGRDVLRALFYAVEQQYETGQALPVTGGQVMMN